jgi:serine/threonine protein kinase/Flp pilus assembly protein TadD
MTDDAATLEASDLRRAISGTLSGDERPGATLRPSPEEARGTLSGLPEETRGTLSGLPEEPRGTLSGPLESEPPGDVALEASEFEVVREVGRGGMGVVYQATQRSLARPVAVKMLLAGDAASTAGERFAAEALVTGRLDHPNIPPVYTYGVDDARRPYLAMKLVNGLAWSDVLDPKTEAARARAARFDLRAHLDVLRRVCDAVAFAHSRGVIHRDLKPENVMIGEFGEVLVMDWGISLDLRARDAAAREPAPGEGEEPRARGPRRPVGTPAYLAPEMALGDDAAAGPWTDIYLLGGILYEILAGAPPHAGENVLEVILAASRGEVEPPERRAPGRKVPEALGAVAMKALAREPKDRYESAAAFAAAIEEYLRHEGAVRLAETAIAELRIAEEDAPHAPARATYERVAGALAALKQAVDAWSENRVAAAGLARARLFYASFAVEQGDLALVEAQLALVPPDDPGLPAVRARQAAALLARAQAERRRRRILAGGLAAAVLAAVALAGALREKREVKKVETASAVRRAAVLATEGASFAESSERIRKYKKAVEIDPSWVEAQAELGRAYIWRAQHRAAIEEETKDLEEAAAPLDRAVALAPKDAEIRASRAFLREMRGDWPGALADYREVLALVPASHEGAIAATEIALGEGRIDDAIAAASKAIEPPGGTDSADFFRRSIARFAKGDYAGAYKDAEKAHKLAPRDTYVDALEAMILLARGERRHAAERIVAGLRTYKRSPPVISLTAYLAAKAGDLDRARALAVLAREVREEHAKAFLALDPCWRAAARAPGVGAEVARAITDDIDAASLAPAELAPSVVFRRRGEERFARGEVEGALADAARALAEDPLDGSAWLLHGRCLATLGQGEAARASLAFIDVLAPERVEDAAAILRGIGKP